MLQFAHEGIQHKTVFEAVMHVLSQWIMIVVTSVILAAVAAWWVSRQKDRSE